MTLMIATSISVTMLGICLAISVHSTCARSAGPSDGQRAPVRRARQQQSRRPRFVAGYADRGKTEVIGPPRRTRR